VTPERLHEIERLFHEARERTPAERDALLARACAHDSTLRREVESLLAQPPAGMIDAPVGALVAGLVAPAGVLLPGRRLGVFEVQELLGVGGMGEVYRARDTRLGREVAIKIVPRAFKDDPDRLARFEREARVLASLNHPHIGAIYGLEEADEITALVMELVDGEDLSQRLARGAIPVAEALPIARQIAEALEAAHEQGIIHRDLKPANIKVRPDGTVKVLDFGLAKALEPTVTARGDVVASPTITSPAMTRMGVILGTAAYMSPEQAKGRPADKRSDVWAFGVVLYEMVTGRRAFDGEDISSTLAFVITKDPDWTALPPATPAPIRRLLRRCLEKDLKRRVPDIGVARLEIDDALATPAEGASAASDDAGGVPRPSRRRVLPVAAMALLTAAAGSLATWAVMRPAPTSSAPLTRFAITLPAAQPLALSLNDRDVAISVDGTHLAYTAGDQAQLMVRTLDQLEAVPLAGIINARAPFLSPNGRWIGFFDRLDEGIGSGPVRRGALRRVSLGGGPSVVLSQIAGASRGASWGPDDSIVFATSDTSTGLLRVAASGGETTVLTTPDAAQGERDHCFPSVLPNARGVLFTIDKGAREQQVAVLDLQTNRRKTLIRSGSQAEYIETGHLIYADAGTLWAVRFDLARLELVGDAAPVIEHVMTLGQAANFSVSGHGTLVYAPMNRSQSRSLVWVDRQGHEEAIAAPPHEYAVPRLSPDGTRAVISFREQESGGLWAWDFSRRTLTRLTFGPTGNFSVWMPDGRHIIFTRAVSAAGEAPNLYRGAVDGTGNEERLTAGDRQDRAVAISPDGKRLVFEELTPTGTQDLMLLALDDSSTPPGTGAPRIQPLLQTPFDQRNAAISPDGRWMAYESTESARTQIYVRPFPNVADAHYQISTDGGRTPVWAANGRELFFVNGSALMAVAVQLTPTFSAGNPTTLFEGPSMLLDGRSVGSMTGRTYDVARDGRFLMIKKNAGSSEATAPPASMIVVQNWFTELQQRVPTR
jgi:Tol biopolymer transport system component